MLEDDTKALIQTTYRQWLAAHALQARRGQREMVAEIARTVSSESGSRVLAIEAGTGTGKTIAYLLGTVPVARQRQRRLVIATATVTLQEQLVGKDLPGLVGETDLEFSYELAKGRGRYVCPQRLAQHTAGGGQAMLPLDLLDDRAIGAGVDCDALLDAFISGRWNGERESLSVEVEDSDWRPLTTDHRGCTGRRCQFFKQCPYFLARARIEQADVIVANHDLVLADLALGGGVVLPEPEDTIYVFDEAHHLADKAQSHFSKSATIGGTRAWLDTINAALSTMAQQLGRPAELMPLVERVVASLPQLTDQLGELESSLANGELSFSSLGDGRRVHRFAGGQPPEDLQDRCGVIASTLSSVVPTLDEIAALLERVMDEKVIWPRASEVEDWFPVAGALCRRAGDVVALFTDYGAPNDRPGEPPKARWLGLRGEAPRQDLELVSVPVAVGRMLDESLWQRCDAAILTSATLTALGRFDNLIFDAGLDRDANCVRLASPFDYARLGTLVIPAMKTDPSRRDDHTEELCRLFPDLLAADDATLALFTSWYQLRTVLASLPSDVRDSVLAQGQLARGEIIARHCERIDRGERSAVFGVASFSEGIDLPGGYCTHVIIAKLPFPVPDDPVAAGMQEWLEQQGRDAFNEISVPAASLRLIQACGRLIRSKDDHGRITLLDRRVVTRRYGRDLLDSLPPFRREIA